MLFLNDRKTEKVETPKFLSVQLVHVQYHTNFRFGGKWWHRIGPNMIAREDNGESATVPLWTLIAVPIKDFPKEKMHLTKALN